MNLLSKLWSKITSATQSLFSRKKQTIHNATMAWIWVVLATSSQNAQANISQQDISKEMQNNALKPKVYVIQPWDSLSIIARKHNLTLDFLLNTNPQFKKNPKLVFPWQKVKIYAMKTYTIQETDSDGLFAVAQRLWVSLETIQELNPQITDINTIHVWDVINIEKTTPKAANDDNYNALHPIKEPQQNDNTTVVIEDMTQLDMKTHSSDVREKQPINDARYNQDNQPDTKQSTNPEVKYSISPEEMQEIDQKIAQQKVQQKGRQISSDWWVEETSKRTIEDFSKKVGENTFQVTESAWKWLNPNVVIPDDIRVIQIVTGWVKQFAYRKNALDEFKPVNQRETGLVWIVKHSKVRLYTEEDLQNKAYLWENKTYEIMSINERFAEYFDYNKSTGKIIAKLPTQDLVRKSRLDDMIPYGKSLVVNFKWSLELIERNPDSGKLEYINPAINQRPKVYNNSQFRILDFAQSVDFKLERKRALDLAQNFWSTLSEKYTQIPSKYRKWGNCGINVRAMVKSLLKVDIPDGWMYGDKWQWVLDNLTIAGWFEKMYVWEPENAPVGSILPYDDGYGEGARYKHGHVEVKLAENEYMHGEKPSKRPGWSLGYVKSKRKDAWFQGFAYIPKKVGKAEFERYKDILAWIEVTPSKASVVAIDTTQQVQEKQKLQSTHSSSNTSSSESEVATEVVVKKSLQEQASIVYDILSYSEYENQDIIESAKLKLLKNPKQVLLNTLEQQVQLSLWARWDERKRILNNIRRLSNIFEDITWERIQNGYFIKVAQWSDKFKEAA